MATPAERFARDAPPIRRVEDPPPAWEAAFADESGVAVYAAVLRDTEERKQLLVANADATERQRKAFTAARSAWQRHSRERAIVPVVATGDEPRPWLALDPPESGDRIDGDPLPEAAVRSLLVDLAEGCWVIQRSPWPGAPDPRQYRLGADGTSAAVRWPLSNRETGESTAVRTLGEIGYEAVTGGEPPAQHDRLPDSVRASGRYSEQLCEVVETALAASPRGYATPYELKRALLFGPARGGAGDPHGRERSWGQETSQSPAGREGSEPGDGAGESRSTARGRSEPGVGRRAVVGALGLSAIPLAGAFAVRSPEDGQGSPAPEPPDASFAFADEGTAIRVTHAGGDPIAADRLIVRNTRYSGIDDYKWAAFGTGGTVEPGDTISIEIGGRVRMFAHVVWRSPDGEETVLDQRESGPSTGEWSAP